MRQRGYVILDRATFRYLTDRKGELLCFNDQAACFRYLQQRFTQYQHHYQTTQRVVDSPLAIMACWLDESNKEG